ncbi:MAG: hypothetical protein C5B57_06175 [Blastocatellia bacterium]|nr:MAG: hypothetical protein C5B57_06175 [Blastocatellia bacterium]
MRCPKCGYLGFDEVDRCRNCGYEFSLAPSAPTPDLSLRPQGNIEVVAVEDLPMPAAPAIPRTPSTSAEDLPLFGAAFAEDAPLITKASPPRPPLAVRRATPEVPRLQSEPRSQMFDLAYGPQSPVTARAPRRGGKQSPVADLSDTRAIVPAGLLPRLFATLLDLLILAAVDVLVVYLTMQICGISTAEFALLPKGPLLAFILLQNGGYLIVFTAGGQTLGKMAAGIKVVAADEGETLDFGRATRRTLLWATLAIPVGLGFLTALFAPDHRALHDRVAGTRVVRASA